MPQGHPHWALLEIAASLPVPQTPLEPGAQGEVLEATDVDEVSWAVNTEREQCVEERAQGNTGV